MTSRLEECLKILIILWYRLDSVGIGGFGHDFGSLSGQTSSVMKAFDAFGTVKPSPLITILFLVGPMFPKLLSRLPNPRRVVMNGLAKSVEGIAGDLLANAAKEKEAGAESLDKSIVGALSKFRWMIWIDIDVYAT
jgi:hypothetical protein